MLATAIRQAVVAAVLLLLTWMCRPLTHLTQTQLDSLQRAYDASGIHPVEFALFKDNRFIDGHYEGLARVMQQHPTWTPPPEVHEIIGAETWRRKFAVRVWSAFVSGTDCQCCLGWRIIALASVALLIGWVAG